MTPTPTPKTDVVDTEGGGRPRTVTTNGNNYSDMEVAVADPQRPPPVDALFHLFLPSSYTPSADNLQEVNGKLLPWVTFSILAKVLPSGSETLQSFLLWEEFQPILDPTPTSRAIAELGVGVTLPIYVHEQNACLLLTQLDDWNVTVSTFRLSLPAEKVTSNLNSFATTFPSYSIKTPKSKIITSKSLIRQLSDLDQVDMRESVATTLKAKMEVVEKRDVAEPIFLSRWLLSVITNTTTTRPTATPKEFPHINKKLRDSVRFQSSVVYRRSALWVCIKVTLHLLLVKEHGHRLGHLLYKTIMLKMMTELLRDNGHGLNSISLLECLVKIGRRAYKLDKLRNSLKEDGFHQEYYDSVYEGVIKLAVSVTKKHHEYLKNILSALIEECKGASTFDLSNLKMWIKQELRSNNFAEIYQGHDELWKKMVRVGQMEPPLQLPFQRHRDMQELFSIEYFETAHSGLNLTLYDFERNVPVWSTMMDPSAATYMWTCFIKYHTIGQEFYKTDNVGYSRFILTLLQMIECWDRVVCENLPLYLSHRPGVNLSGVLKDILVTSKKDMLIIHKLEDYFNRRTQKAEFPSVIEETSPSTSSFSHRYVEQSKRCGNYREHILEHGKKQTVKKLNEVHAARERCEKLEAAVRKLECTYVVDDWKRRHDPKCERCRLSKQAQNMTVLIYETPLPVGREMQNSVVFELIIPEVIGVMRDLLYIFRQEVTAQPLLTTPLNGPWHYYSQIVPLKDRSKEFLVGLWSEKKLFVDTHFRSLHPTNPDADFIKVNGYNCVYGTQHTILNADLPILIKNKTTFRVEKKSRYSNLQPGIIGDYSQNDAIARQNECHPDLNLTEFVEFLSLRSVKNIQFRSLYRALNAGTLSLREESVYHLISQVIYSGGSSNDHQSIAVVLRQHQLDFCSKEFSEKYLHLLETIRSRGEDNWKDHYVLLTVITLTQTISNMNPAIERAAFTLLQSCRRTCVRWSNEILKILKSLAEKEAPRSEIDSLRIKLIEVSSCIALSFRVSEIFLYEVISDGTFIDWLLSVARIHDSLVLLGDFRPKKPSFRNLLARVDEVGVELEVFIQEAIRSSDLLTRFVEQHHSGSKVWKMREKQKMDWKSYPDGQVYYCDIVPPDGVGENSRIQMDVVKGKFLVDGSPVGYLPVAVEHHPDFQRVFGAKSFEVIPYAYQKGRLITKTKFLNSNYSFYLSGNQDLLIVEHRDNDIKTELIEEHRFYKNIPELLIQNYTHWYNPKKYAIEFFRKEKKLTTEAPEYVLELHEKYLQCVKEPMVVVVDITCQGSKAVLSVMSALEEPRHIIMFCNRGHRGGTFQFTVDMPRMGLHFNISNTEFTQPQQSITIHNRSHNNYYNYNNNTRNNRPLQQNTRRLGDITSKEYRGMRISKQQHSIETLIGLKSCLLLEDANLRATAPVNQVLLIPHATPFVHRKHNDIVLIDTSELRSPPFFAYEVDSRLKQLKSGDSRSGWIYLAYLHALTNHGIADPFTGVSGMERALQILQSALSFTSEPLDTESLRTLELFKELCPLRVYYPEKMKTMEHVKSNPDSPPRCLSDAYYLIIDQLIDDSERLSFLYPDRTPTIELLQDERFREPDLILKAYWSGHWYANELSRLNGQYLPSEEPLTEPYFEPHTIDDVTLNTLALSQDLQNWTCSKIGVKSGFQPNMLKSLLLNGFDLKGIIPDTKFPLKDGSVNIWSRADFFRDHWLDLYVLARKIRRKNLETEWTFMLTYFMFQKTKHHSDTNTKHSSFVCPSHLQVLHTIAVHSDLFTVDPPLHENYTLTKETDFNKEEIKTILKSYKKPWEQYMDKNQEEMKPWEDAIEFVERMKPQQEIILQDQIDTIADKIEKQWPIDHLDWLEIDQEETSEIHIFDALPELSMKIRAWFKNRELFRFLDQVEQTLSSIKIQVKARPEGKSIFRQCGGREALKKYCSGKRVTIDFDLFLHKQIPLSHTSKVEMARQLFHVDVSKYAERNRNNRYDDTTVPQFPLDITPQDDHGGDPVLCEYMEDLKRSWTLHHLQKEQKKRSKRASTSEEASRNYAFLTTELRKYKKECHEMWEVIRDIFIPRGKDAVPPIDQILLNAELFPRIVPIQLFKKVLLDKSSPPPLRSLTGGYAILSTLEQKYNRVCRYGLPTNRNRQQNNTTTELELRSELSNNGHENWNPADKPEWLLFELESDLLIRPIQAKVAEKMEHPDGDENALIQLNMGEGKTWVIAPLLALSLADTSKLCRLTVLKSLFQINKTYITYRIGTLILDRRIYCFPMRRDFKIGPGQAKQLMNLYEECMDLKGVVLTLPEHRLSFELKAFERFHARSFDDGLGLRGVQNWLAENARDVLDESDEILNVKYNLVYTLGKTLPVFGGSTRWTVPQDLLTILPSELLTLSLTDPSMVEVKPRSNAFPYIRILKPEAIPTLINSIASKIINYQTPIALPRLAEVQKKALFDFFTKEELTREELNYIYKSFSNESTQEKILVIRGYLACGVLANCLMKRWRVNYGVSVGHYRRLAVPFRAKDVASERVEFGHPDVAILLTQLSYYYSGLNCEQLEHCFVMLGLEQGGADKEYASWVSLIDDTKYPDKSRIKTLQSVNLNDFFQKTEILFPLLQYNTKVIDFYLSKAIFPQESKVFGYKIGCSPWDLTNTATTGFSGTNDSKILLPSTIKQKDLKELKGTNGGVLAAILDQGDNYEVLEDVSAMKILRKLADANIRILLDVGALMLELDNEQVARSWLQLLHDSSVSVDAAVFFDANDKLQVYDGISSTIQNFELSTFRNRLDRCVVYLDDAHTRGTDLKIPVGNSAVVTLGKGVGKDKLVQGCMRMRKLGNGHSVKFWASPEVNESILHHISTTQQQDPVDPQVVEEDDQITPFTISPTISSKQVLLWSIRNSEHQIKEGMVLWASAGVYTAQKLSALEIYEQSDKLDSDLVTLAETCSQKEQIELKQMYGDTRQVIPFPTIVQHLLKRVRRELGKLLKRHHQNSSKDSTSIVEDYGKCVVDHVTKYVPDMERSTQLLDEEQERELEHELEAQCQVQMPLKAKALEHCTSIQVLRFLRDGSLSEMEKWAVKAPLVFQNTSVWKVMGCDTWGRNIYATKDFASTVKPDSRLTDEYLRNVEWFALLTTVDRKEQLKTVVLLLSNYEVGEYLDVFRSGKAKATLHMYNALTSEHMEPLHDKKPLTLPMRQVSFDVWLDPPLTLFSGGYYFPSPAEEDDYAWYLCYCRGKDKIDEKVLEQGGIVGNWVKNEFWGQVSVSGVFAECPEGLVKEILRCRWGVLRRLGRESGVGRVVGGGSNLSPAAVGQ